MVQCTLNGASAGFAFFQEMRASAINDALIPVKKTLFALRFSVCLGQFKQLYIAHVLHHFLGLLTKMGCRHCFVVVRLEDLVHEGGSRSS